MSRDWIAALKVGDEVVAHKQIAKVTRVLPSVLVLNGVGRGELRAARKTGRLRGGGYSWICEATPEARQQIRYAALLSWARYSAGAELVALSLDQIAKVHDLINKFTKEQDDAKQ